MKRLATLLASALLAFSALAATSVDDEKTGIPTGGGGSGTVSSVAASGANGIAVSGSPITGTGTLALSLGNITPTSVSTGTVTGTASYLSGAGGYFATLRNSSVESRVLEVGYDQGAGFVNQAWLGYGIGARVPLASAFQWGSAAQNWNYDLALWRDAAGVMAQRDGTNAQGFRIYNTYTDASNHERAFFQWSSNAFEIGVTGAGTGSNARDIRLSANGGVLYFAHSNVDRIAMGSAVFRPNGAGGMDLGQGNIGWKRFYLDYTDTATVGAVTINKALGRVNVAAAGSSIVVTNNLVTASAKVFTSVCSNDATAYIKNTVPAAGSFTITLGAAATAQTCIDFFVVNSD